MVHELNQCGTARSTLFDQGLGNFFLDDMFAYETRIVVPGAAPQARSAAMLASSAPLKLHKARYNMLAYPFATSYQNSNQWLLETYATSMSDVPVDERAGAGLAETGRLPADHARHPGHDAPWRAHAARQCGVRRPAVRAPHWLAGSIPSRSIRCCDSCTSAMQRRGK